MQPAKKTNKQLNNSLMHKHSPEFRIQVEKPFKVHDTIRIIAKKPRVPY